MNRPFVYINMAITVDGKITSAAREYPRLTTPHDRTNMDRLRAEADAILVGARTLRADSPKLHVRTAEMQEYRRSLGKSAGLLKILVTGSAELDADSRLFDDQDNGGIIVATVDNAPADRIAELSARSEIWKLGRERVDLRELLARLHRRGVGRLLVEGGGEINWEFIKDGLVDEIFVTIAPHLLGGRDAPTLLDGDGLSMKNKTSLRLIDIRREGDELYCRYAVES